VPTHFEGVGDANNPAGEPEDEEVDPASVQWVKQSILQDIMVAGLLAAARIRPVI